MIHRCQRDKRDKAEDNENMEQPKTYVATIEVTFEAYEKENPRSIAKYMAESHSGMRGANLYSYGELGQVRLFQNGTKKTTSK